MGQVGAKMALTQNGGVQRQGKAASSPEVTDKGEAEGPLKDVACKEGLPGARKPGHIWGPPKSSIRLEEGRVCRCMQEKQLIIKSSSKVPQNQLLEPEAGVLDGERRRGGFPSGRLESSFTALLEEGEGMLGRQNHRRHRGQWKKSPVRYLGHAVMEPNSK